MVLKGSTFCFGRARGSAQTAVQVPNTGRAKHCYPLCRRSPTLGHLPSVKYTHSHLLTTQEVPASKPKPEAHHLLIS